MVSNKNCNGEFDIAPPYIASLAERSAEDRRFANAWNAPDQRSFWAPRDLAPYDVAQRMSDGECIDRTDCCFTYESTTGDKTCGCTADPTLLGQDTCAALAAAKAGEVVELCDEYKPYTAGTNVPR
jgi:hypothetical protein